MSGNSDMDRSSILLVVTGLSPQVITETLFAMHQQGQVMPEEIHILTTAEGYQRVRLTLINDGWLARFYHDYQLPAAVFSKDHIHILQQKDGTELADIRTQADNQDMADGITEWIRELTTNPETKLHVSIAGGRKTMGFYAGYALSLYGRPQDCLSHVLVSADFESHPQFFYPTPYSQVIYANDPTRKPLDTKDAAIMLADIPFVRLRHGLDPALLAGKSSFSASVAKAQAAIGPANLVINIKKRLLIAQDTPIKLNPTDLAFYLWLLDRQKNGKSAPGSPSEGAPEMHYTLEYFSIYQQLTGDMWASDRTSNTLKTGMSKTFFEQRKSRVNTVLKQSLSFAAQAYLISPHGKRPRTYYQIALNKDQIHYQTGE